MFVRPFMCLCVVAITSNHQVTAGIIPSGQIAGHHHTGDPALVGGRVDYTATGSDTRTITSFGGSASSTHTAMTTTGGLKSRLVSAGSGFFSVHTGVLDVYTVTGGTPGDILNFNAVLNLEGDVSIAAGDFGGSVFVRGAIGLGLSNASAIGGNPVISGGRANAEQKFTSKGATTPFDFDIVAPLTVQSGTPFQLSFSTEILHSKFATTDMLDTASVSFELPSGYSISSVEGFGTESSTSPVPEPSSIVLLGIGAIGFVGCRRRLRIK